MRTSAVFTFGILPLLSLACSSSPTDPQASRESRSFAADLEFLEQHTKVIVLRDRDELAQVAVVPAWQGRVMTSTSAGPQGASFGWVNYELIESGRIEPHINVYGGEDRFWMGPEGGQFAIFFKEGDPFDLEHWQTPPCIDTEPFETARVDDREAVFTRQLELTNYSGVRFSARIDRSIHLLAREEVESGLGVEVEDDVAVVAFESRNTLTNLGPDPWRKDSGLLSIWILGMFVPAPRAAVLIPFRGEADASVVNDSYFGEVPDDRLVVGAGTVFFKADGKYRSKIGLSPRRATPLLGAWDPDGGTLTLVRYSLPEGVEEYVNSMWEIQESPFAGDVINSYNDGPPSPGAKPLGPFFELETSSPAAALQPGEGLTHVHRTIHLTGDPAKLDRLARATLGVNLADSPW